MVVINTNIVMARVKAGERIRENITEVTAVEYPPVIEYRKFHGEKLITKDSDFKDIAEVSELEVEVI